MQANADNMGVDAGFDALDYGYADSPNASAPTAARAERNLWCAVIAQAFVDIGAIKPATSFRDESVQMAQGYDFDKAAYWLLYDNRHFLHVCDLAGVSASAIRRAAFIFYSKLLMQSEKEFAVGAEAI